MELANIMNKLETQHSGNEQFGSCVSAIEFATTVSIIARHLKTLGDSMLSSRVDTYLYFLANGPMFEVPVSHLVLKKHVHKTCGSDSSYDISTVTPRVCHPFGIKMVLEPSSLKSALHNRR